MTRATKKQRKWPNGDGKFKSRTVFVPNGDGGVWQVARETCIDCGERFIVISGKSQDRDVLFTKLRQVVDEQMSQFVGNEEVKFCLEVTAIPST